MNNTLSQSKSNKYFKNSPIRILKGKGIWIIGILFQPKSFSIFYFTERVLTQIIYGQWGRTRNTGPLFTFYLVLLFFLLFKEKRKKFRYLIINRTPWIICQPLNQLLFRNAKKKITLFHFLLLTLFFLVIYAQFFFFHWFDSFLDGYRDSYWK